MGDLYYLRRAREVSLEWVLGEEASSWEGLKELTDDNVLVLNQYSMN